jgi:hypothetical protein
MHTLPILILKRPRYGAMLVVIYSQATLCHPLYLQQRAEEENKKLIGKYICISALGCLPNDVDAYLPKSLIMAEPKQLNSNIIERLKTAIITTIPRPYPPI